MKYFIKKLFRLFKRKTKIALNVSEIGEKEFKRLYLSKPRTYKERLKSEIEDLKRKTKKLLIYIDEKSNPEEKGILKTQYITMLEYLNILEKRRNKIKC